MGQKFYFQDNKHVSSLFIGGFTPILSIHIRLLYNVILTRSLPPAYKQYRKISLSREEIKKTIWQHKKEQEKSFLFAILFKAYIGIRSLYSKWSRTGKGNYVTSFNRRRSSTGVPTAQHKLSGLSYGCNAKKNVKKKHKNCRQYYVTSRVILAGYSFSFTVRQYTKSWW
jgi:hypothetical protein